MYDEEAIANVEGLSWKHPLDDIALPRLVTFWEGSWVRLT